MAAIKPERYLEELKKRGKRSRIYTKHQLLGLQIANELGDNEHKALYMKLAKTGNTAKLQWLAADVADRKNLKKPGAYFMATLMKTEKEAKEWLKKAKK
ncbi:MAG TPA: hypothetical protein VNG29_03920 [Candidatus Paceibacterota bacterium]|nr:hypothetical protein [Candidatus Paceibacterota bacterium]